VTSTTSFGEFELHPAQRRLVRAGTAVPVGSRAFDLLCVLVEHRERVVGKDELLALAWRGAVVEENNLSVQISALRRALGDGCITTVPGRGYRWTQTTWAQGAPALQAAMPRPAQPSIAILPFTIPPGAGEDEYFADGLAEGIVAGLTRSRWLRVMAHSASMAFRTVDMQPIEVCKALGVHYIVRGSMRRQGDSLRVAAELVDGRDGQAVWAQHYDRPHEALFDIQDDIAERIVGTVEPAFLRREEAQAVRLAERDLAQWELLMRARWHYWRSSRKHLGECKRFLELALARKPDDVPALSLMAFALATEVWSGWAADAKAGAVQANKLALRAVSLDDGDAFAHFSLGVTLLGFGQLDRAIAEHRRALQLHPHFAAASAELGRLLAYSGQVAEGEALIRRAIAASPTEPRMALWIFSLGIACFVDGRDREGAQHACAAIAQRPDWFFNHFLLAACLSACGDDAPARQALEEGVRLMPGFSAATLPIGHPFRHAHHRDRYVGALRRVGWNG